jgi:hypothetical protein
MKPERAFLVLNAIGKILTLTSWLKFLVIWRCQEKVNNWPIPNGSIFSFQLEHRDVAASQTLRAALSKVESSHPGFSYDFVLGLVRKGDVKVNLNESLLRLQGSVTEQDSEYRGGIHQVMPEVMPEIIPAGLSLEIMPAFPFDLQFILAQFYASTFHQITLLAWTSWQAVHIG